MQWQCIYALFMCKIWSLWVRYLVMTTLHGCKGATPWVHECHYMGAWGSLNRCISDTAWAHECQPLLVYVCHCLGAWGLLDGRHCMGAWVPLLECMSATTWVPKYLCIGAWGPPHGWGSVTAWECVCLCMGAWVPLHAPVIFNVALFFNNTVNKLERFSLSYFTA